MKKVKKPGKVKKVVETPTPIIKEGEKLVIDIIGEKVKIEKKVISKLTLSTGRADFDSMVDKINEVIDVLNN